MQQNAEHGADAKDRNIAVLGAGRSLVSNLAAAAEQEARDVRNNEKKTFAGDLPGYALVGRVFEHGRHGTRAHGDGGRAGFARRNGAGQIDLARNGETGDTIEVHGLTPDFALSTYCRIAQP